MQQKNLNYSSETLNNFYLESLGCAKNSVDSETIISILKKAGLTYSEDPKNADFIIVNSCGFIDIAKEESINTVLEYKNLFPDTEIILTGCLAQRYLDDLNKNLREAQFIIGNEDVENSAKKIATYILNKIDKKKSVIFEETEFIKRDFQFSKAGSAYLKISEGCNNLCSFCAIPLIRGKIKSRTIENIYREFIWLLENNIYEINLISQDLCSFGIDRGNSEFIELLKKLLSVKKDFIIRMLYIHPDNFDLKILNLCKNDNRLLPYFDIPFQHASDKIIKQMNRKKTGENFLTLIKTIRETLPNSIIRSSIMCGFPGEDEEDFLTLKKFLSDAKIDWVGFFIYSLEEGTKAYKLISEKEYKSKLKIAQKRKNELEKIQEKILKENLNKFLDQIYDFLIEEEIPDSNIYLGRAYFQAPEVDGTTVITGENLKSGDIVKCRVKKILSPNLKAEVI